LASYKVENLPSEIKEKFDMLTQSLMF